MAPDVNPPLPGSMTVPPLFGWEHIMTALVLVGALAVAFLLLAAARAAGSGRSEWQAWLDARSSTFDEQATEPHEDPAEAAGPGTGR